MAGRGGPRGGWVLTARIHREPAVPAAVTGEEQATPGQTGKEATESPELT